MIGSIDAELTYIRCQRGSGVNGIDLADIIPDQDAIRAAQAIAAGTGRYRPALQAQRIASKAHAALGAAAYHILIGQIVVPGKLMFITDIDLRLGIAGPAAAINARGSGTVRQHVIAAALQFSPDPLEAGRASSKERVWQYGIDQGDE